MSTSQERFGVGDGGRVHLAAGVGATEYAGVPRMHARVECFEANPAQAARYQALIARASSLRERAMRSIVGRMPMIGSRILARMLEESRLLIAEAVECYSRPRWSLAEWNVVTTTGKNDLLDKYFAGSAYTAAWFCGLISSVSYTTGPAVGDTMASHGGWTEAGATNAPNYTGNRVAITFSAASGGSKTVSAASSFTFSASGTIKGLFTCANSTKDGSTGPMYNAVLFTGGDQPVASSNVVNVSPTYTVS